MEQSIYTDDLKIHTQRYDKVKNSERLHEKKLERELKKYGLSLGKPEK